MRRRARLRAAEVERDLRAAAAALRADVDVVARSARALAFGDVSDLDARVAIAAAAVVHCERALRACDEAYVLLSPHPERFAQKLRELAALRFNFSGSLKLYARHQRELLAVGANVTESRSIH